MKKNIGILLLCALLSSLMANAYEYPTLDNDSIKKSYRGDEVIIVAFKGNENLSVQPISANLLSDKSLKDYNIQTIKDITAFVPNFFMPDYGSKLTSPVYIRGIGSRINSPSVGLYVDGVPYFDRSSFDFNINGIDRIEVLRGPQGTIFGRNTMGGIINVYTKSPFRHKESNIGASVGNYENYKIEASHVGNINETFGYSFSGNYLHNGGYFDNEYSNRKADKMDALSGRIRLGWQITSQLVAYLTSALEYSDQDGYPYGIYNATDNTVNAVNYNEQAFYRRNMSNNGFTLEYKTPYFHLGSQTSFQYFDGKQGIDQDFTPSDNYYVVFNHRQRMYSQEFNIKSVIDNRYKWQFGAFGFYQDYSQTNDVDTRIPDKEKESITDVTNPTMGWAVYHQSTIDRLFDERLSLVMGVRYDWEKTKMENNTIVLSDGNTTVNNPISGKNIYNQFTPKVSLQYAFQNESMFYYSVTRGYKSGGFNTTVEEEKDRTFEPEYSWSHELGLKFNCFDKILNTDVSFFYIDWTDQQISQKRASEQGFKIRNAGKSVSKGMEVTTHINPAKGLGIHLSYGYTHAKFKEYLYDENKGLDYSNNFLPLVPRNTFSAAADYSIDIKKQWLDKVTFNAQYIGVGSLYWSDDNQSKQQYYNTLNAQVSLIRKNLTVDFWTKNITDEKYITYYFESMGNKFAQQSKPFTLGMNMNVKF